ncbi:MAG: P-II family nitrogen regulator [Clostridiales bacterium]|nr:P-II family nitrogen regulator [Clostridiales bacterium]
MHDLRLLVVIVKREYDEDLTAFLRDNDVESIFGLLCQGTASQKLLSLMGLEKTGKALIYTMVRKKKAKRLMTELVSTMGLDMHGNGCAMTIPVGSIAGASSLKYLTKGQKIIIGEVANVEEQVFLYELIVAITNRGHVDSVMDAARAAGAMGGTVIHARGTNPFGDNKFFGMPIADEKEMLLILTAAKDKSEIMRCIMENAGLKSPAHTVMFSLPVENVAGLRSVMEAAGEISSEDDDE